MKSLHIALNITGRVVSAIKGVRLHRIYPHTTKKHMEIKLYMEIYLEIQTKNKIHRQQSYILRVYNDRYTTPQWGIIQIHDNIYIMCLHKQNQAIGYLTVCICVEITPLRLHSSLRGWGGEGEGHNPWNITVGKNPSLQPNWRLTDVCMC